MRCYPKYRILCGAVADVIGNSHRITTLSAADKILVLDRGRIVEEGPVDRVFYHPQEEYTKRLIASRPTRKKLKGGMRRG